jgi:hypothetical protein
MKLWCPLCKRKVEVKNVSERMVLINHGSRKMAEGIDMKGHRVAQFIPTNPTIVPAKKVHRKKRKVIRTYMDV